MRQILIIPIIPNPNNSRPRVSFGKNTILGMALMIIYNDLGI